MRSSLSSNTYEYKSKPAILQPLAFTTCNNLSNRKAHLSLEPRLEESKYYIADNLHQRADSLFQAVGTRWPRQYIYLDLHVFHNDNMVRVDEVFAIYKVRWEVVHMGFPRSSDIVLVPCSFL